MQPFDVSLYVQRLTKSAREAVQQCCFQCSQVIVYVLVASVGKELSMAAVGYLPSINQYKLTLVFRER